jgi:hypothetical protein
MSESVSRNSEVVVGSLLTLSGIEGRRQGLLQVTVPWQQPKGTGQSTDWKQVVDLSL